MKLFLKLIILVCITCLGQSYHLGNNLTENDLETKLAFNKFLEMMKEPKMHISNSFNSYSSSNPSLSSNHNLRSKVDSFLFNCDGLKPGLYSDVYNECKYFMMCHQSNLKFNPSNQLAFTTYVCPEGTFFNQIKLTCTQLELFEMPCTDQIKLFKRNSNENNLNDQMRRNLLSFYDDYFEKIKPNHKLTMENRALASDLSSDKILIDESVLNKLQDNRRISENGGLTDELNKLNLVEFNKRNEIDQPNARIESNTNDENDKLLLMDEGSLGKDDVEIIETTFSCEHRPHGYYVDIFTDCEIFHVCQPLDESHQINHQTSTHIMDSFRCPEKLVFNQVTLTCTNVKDLIVPCKSQEIFFAKIKPKNYTIETTTETATETTSNQGTTLAINFNEDKKEEYDKNTNKDSNKDKSLDKDNEEKLDLDLRMVKNNEKINNKKNVRIDSKVETVLDATTEMRDEISTILPVD